MLKVNAKSFANQQSLMKCLFFLRLDKLNTLKAKPYYFPDRNGGIVLKKELAHKHWIAFD